MILQVRTNETTHEVGDYIVFFTGEKSINVYPKLMRIGVVLSVGKTIGCVDEVREIATGKIWRPYSLDCIAVKAGISVKGVQPTLNFVDKL